MDRAQPHPLHRRRRGLGLIELMISLAICATLLIAVGAAYQASSDAMGVNDRIVSATQSGRVAITHLSRDLRICQNGSVATNSLLLTLPDGETHQYVYNPQGKVLTISINGGSPAVLARNVAAATFATDSHSVSVALTLEIGEDRVHLSTSAMPRRWLN
jgi:YD repeat-containing protein